MASRGRALLGKGGSGYDAQWINNDYGENHTDFEQDFEKSMDYVDEYYDIPTKTNLPALYGSGAPLYFEVGKVCDKSAKMSLMITRSAIASTDANARPCFNDFELYSAIDTIDWTYGGMRFHTSKGKDLMKELLLGWATTERDRECEARMQNGFLPQALRIARGAAQQTVTCNLQVPWEELNKQMPLMALSDPIAIEVNFKPLNRCVQCVSALAPNACSITSAFIRIEGTLCPLKEQQHLFSQVANGTVSLKTITRQYQDHNPLDAGITSATIPLTHFKASTVFLLVSIRPMASVDQQNTLDLWNFKPADRYWISDVAEPVTKPLDYTGKNAIGRNNDLREAFPGVLDGSNLAHLPFCRNQFILQSKNHSLGDKDMSTFIAPALELRWNSPTPVPYYVDITAYVHNRLIYTKGFVKPLMVV